MKKKEKEKRVEYLNKKNLVRPKKSFKYEMLRKL